LWLEMMALGVMTAQPSQIALSAKEADSAQTVIAAGDIGECRSGGYVGTPAEATALLVDSIPGTVLALGDLVYPNGRAAEFKRCYEPTWGRFKKRTRPVPGNHEYNTPGAEPYFAYWGERAGPRGGGFYSFDLGAWHIVALNSNIVTSALGKTQEVWLKADLVAHRTKCALAFFHHPRFTSGWHGNNDKLKDLWDILYDAGVDVALSGHDHDYERLAPMGKEGELDADRGIRQFVAGTGGAMLGPFPYPHPQSEVKDSSAFGVLKLTLREREYEWAFMAAPDGTVLDHGKAACH